MTDPRPLTFQPPSQQRAADHADDGDELARAELYGLLAGRGRPELFRYAACHLGGQARFFRAHLQPRTGALCEAAAAPGSPGLPRAGGPHHHLRAGGDPGLRPGRVSHRSTNVEGRLS
jgi:hypothetical protein